MKHPQAASGSVGLLLPALLAAAMAIPGHALALTLGQIDTFSSGTTQGWLTSLLGNPNPVPPVLIPGGGPSGVNDSFLRLTSLGGSGAGSRLTVINVSQWAGDYLAAGVNGISMNLRNLGSTDLSLRLLIDDPGAGPPANAAISSSPILLAAGGDWTSVYFPIALPEMTAIVGSAGAALSGATELRLFHSTTAGFPGDPILASLGVDDIQAMAAPVPEPSTWFLLTAGVGALAFRRRR